MKAPRVSVICIFFNEERFLAEAVDSVLAQQFRDFELLLVDDGSDDASTAIAKAYASEHPAVVRFLEHPGHVNRGSSAARNLGLHHARGEFVTWLDGDDRFRPDKLTEQVRLLDAHPDVGMVCGAYLRWGSWAGGEDVELLSGHRADKPSYPPETTLGVYPLGWSKNPTETMIRRDIALRVGGFEEDFPGLYDDQTFYSKAFLETGAIFSDRIWLDYRQHPESCTAQVGWRKYLDTRRRFLDWFEDYLRTRPVVGKEDVMKAIRRARDRLRHRLLMRVGRRLDLVRLNVLRLAGFEERYRRDRHIV